MTTKRYCLTNYTVQCTDQASGRVGCFLFDVERYRREGKFWAISTVHPDLDALFCSADRAAMAPAYIEFEGGDQ